MLVGSDFFGIQNFIFSSGHESASYRSKILRGRSFGVSLFSELAADMLCRAMGLPHLSVVLNAAGKFNIIAPNTESARAAVVEVREKINSWLYAVSYGQSSMGLACTPASPAEFHLGSFATLWSRHKGDMELAKSNKIDLAKNGGAVSGYLDSFDNTLSPDLCPFCGVRPAQIMASGDPYLGEEGAACRICRDHIMLGTRLVKSGYIVIHCGEDRMPGKEKLLSPLFGEYQLSFVEEKKLQSLSVESVRKVWNTKLTADGSIVSTVTNRLINGYVPVYSEQDLHDSRLTHPSRKEEDRENLVQGATDGRPKTFGDIARLALFATDTTGTRLKGTEALGILKADVDQLGLLMGCGLPENRYSISRIATLSRQLDSFFSVYLPSLLRSDERFGAVYTVFAGGDDLFLIGPWNRMVNLASMLRKEFARFVCNNDQIHFSAGITIGKPHSPLDSFAERAERDLEYAKDLGRNMVTVFEQTVTWDVLEELMACQEQMERWRDTYVSSSVFYRFNELVTMAEEEKKLNREHVHITDMQCLRWRGQLQYQLSRNLNSRLRGDEREKALSEITQLAHWLEQYGGAMRIPLWTILYNNR
jgi:CRISPR-associated protein Csm1